MNLIVIAGMPATGKTTIANQIRDFLGYPVFEKDYLKEALFDIIGFECYAEKRRHDMMHHILKPIQTLFLSV